MSAATKECEINDGEVISNYQSAFCDFCVLFSLLERDEHVAPPKNNWSVLGTFCP